MNKVILSGNLGSDPEIRYTQSGTPVANVSLATNEKWKDKSGEKQERTEWHKLVLWDKQAELAGEYLKKGSKILVEGRIQSSSWETDGERKYKTEIVVTNLEFLDTRSSEGPAAQDGDYHDQKPSSAGGGRSVTPDEEDDLPF